MSFPAYREYKDSGRTWLGYIPAHWQLLRIGSLFFERREKADGAHLEPLSVSMNGVVPKLEQAAKSKDTDNRKKVRRGDFVINSRSDRQGAAGVSPTDGSVSLISVVMTPHGIHPEYAHHLLRSTGFQQEFYRRGKGIVDDLWSTGFRDIKNAYLPVPPVDEQRKIADFLDHETARIDALIEEQQRLIALLEEKDQAAISRATTKGIHDGISYKESGYNWIGEIPAHWSVLPIRRVTHKVTTGGTPKPGAFDDNGIPWYTPGDFPDDGTLADARKSVRSSEPDVTLFPAGTVLLVGIGATLGKLGIAPNQCSANQQVNGLIPRDSVSNKFLMYALSARTDAIKELSNASTIGIVNQEKTKQIPVGIPPRGEQEQIVNFIDKKLSESRRLKEISNKAIGLLHERRSALVSSAVTGKIDVRESNLVSSDRDHKVSDVVDKGTPYG